MCGECGAGEMPGDTPGARFEATEAVGWTPTGPGPGAGVPLERWSAAGTPAAFGTTPAGWDPFCGAPEG